MKVTDRRKWLWFISIVLVLWLLGSSLMPVTTTTTTGTAASAPPTTQPANTPQPVTTSIPTASPSTANVKSFGAVGDGVANDTDAIQRALDSGSTIVSIPDGTYLIDAQGGLRPMSNQTVLLDSHAALKVIPNAAGSYQVFLLVSVRNVEIFGGQLLGDRSAHLGKSGEYGMGILVGKGTDDIRIRNIAIHDFWGDGIYIGSDSSGIARNVLVENVVCDNNRRQGLTITQAESVIVRNSIFRNTKGIAPQSGLDIEPNSGCYVSNVTIQNNQFTGNAGSGLIINGAAGKSVNAISVDSNTFSGNTNGVVIGAANASDISLVVPAGTTRIHDNEFAQCYGLSRITIPVSVTAIGSGAFRACGRLTSVTIPERVTTIGVEAFKYCTGLTSVNIPPSVMMLDNWAFIGCSNLSAAYFHGDAPVTTDYVFYNCAADFKIYYVAGKAGFTSPIWHGYPADTFTPL